MPADAVFYYDLSSPFAYLSALRVDELIPGIEWRPIAFPFLLRAQGRVPWSLQPGREEGMREVERRAAERGLPPVRWAEGWPAQTWSVDAIRGAVHADRQGRQREWTRAAFEVLFVEGRPQGEAIEEIAQRAGVDPAGIHDDEVKQRLRDSTDEAIARGVPGIPTMAIGDELFWGDDRLEEAASQRG